MGGYLSKEYYPKKSQGYVLCVETHEDGSQTETRIPYHRSGPSMLRKAKNFAEAGTAHACDHLREATDEQVDARHAICKACPAGMYSVKKTHALQTSVKIEIGKCLHMSCGCDIGPALYPERNKLRWASSFCPEKLWGSV